MAGCLEMYDFALFGFFSSIFFKNYFSFLNPSNALIITYALFAVGFVFRPIGSIIFGYIGDIYGRKKSLVISVTFMGVASLAMFMLPTYDSIGISSCYLIVLIRILQGISVGGEYSGALIYAIEHFDKKKTGMVGGIIITGSVVGTFLAIIVTNIVQMSVFPSYSWRFAFLLGFGLSLVGYFIRKNLLESPEFLLLKNKSKIPLLEGIKKHPLESIGSIFVGASNGINFYFILVFLPNYINEKTSLSIDYYPIITITILIILSPIFAIISDKVNRIKLIQYGLLTLAIYNVVGLQLITYYNNYIAAVTFFIIHAIIYSTQVATVNIFIVEIFPTKYRYSCASFCYSIGVGVLGGVSPFIASLIKTKYLDYINIYISVYLALVCFMGFISVKLIEKIKINNSKFKKLKQNYN
jgi:MHS family proline/betaine transporter-like MFS transporter